MRENTNSGDYNSGNRNSSNWNSGSFNTDEPKMRLFNKDLDMTVSEFREKHSIYMGIPLNRWVDKKDMTDKEKSEVEGWETMGGYLKTLDYKEACRVWWAENPSEHERFLTLPGFDADIFLEITGIDTTKPEESIEIEGKKYAVSEIKKALNKLQERKGVMSWADDNYQEPPEKVQQAYWEAKNKKKCEHIPVEKQVTERYPGGVVHTHHVSGDVCMKCGELC